MGTDAFAKDVAHVVLLTLDERMKILVVQFSLSICCAFRRL